MKIFSLFLILVLAGLSVRAASLDEANRAFEAGRYDEAAKMFQQVVKERGYSAPLCFDLANAEWKAGRRGTALLNYERARYLAPGDAGINHNLQLARKEAGLQPNPYRWWEVVIRSIDWSVWLIVILSCLGLIVLALVGLTLARQQPAGGVRKVCRALLFICIPVALFFGFVELIAVGFGDRIEGVIVVKEATLRLSPFESAEKTGTLPEGELVTIEKRHNDYLWIDERNKQSGWVAEKELEPVVPGSVGKE